MSTAGVNPVGGSIFDDENKRANNVMPPRTARKPFGATASGTSAAATTTKKKVPGSEVKGNVLSSRKLFGELDTNREGRGESKSELKSGAAAPSVRKEATKEKKVRFEDLEEELEKSTKLDEEAAKKFIRGGWRDDDEEVEQWAGATLAERLDIDKAYLEQKEKELQEKWNAKLEDINLEDGFSMPWFKPYESLAKKKIPLPDFFSDDSPLNPFRGCPNLDETPPICEDFVFEDSDESDEDDDESDDDDDDADANANAGADP
mmetsp:Transcript_14842/g.48418  ORF Transcript_14842/g.48418 Transcript_14842/m.48418 type:complete len:262 (+) Transcript_14842:76-861(+)